MQGAVARPLPRSRQSPTGAARPMSMPTSLDDFSSLDTSKSEFQNLFSRATDAKPGVSPPVSLRMKKPAAPAKDEVAEAPTRRTNGSVQAFGNRYDFGASLTAAMKAANTYLGDRQWH